ncbi:MAG TPA: FecR domain-containing protein [Sunxiuqinia sp.]|nr:FecR domain-containing protein [Sunxiuqinia sp.]
MEQQNIPWEAISTYLNDTSDKKNESIIKEWVKESPENIRHFNEIFNTHQLTRQKPVYYQPNKEQLWKELMNRISPNQRKPKVVGLSWVRYVAVAAAIVLAFFVGRWFAAPSQMNQSAATAEYAQVIAPPGQRTQMVLPDQTKVWLNSGSKIKYPASFSGKDRNVFIKGECYFEVTKNKHKPFIVHASDVNVKVYGTHFDVKENAKNDQSVVTLLEGKVEVLNSNNQSLSYLDPGEQLKVHQNRYQKLKVNNMEALIAWTNGMLVFKDQPFEEVIDYLENWYGVKIKLDTQLYNKHHFTFKVKTESLREVLDLISVITPIDYKIEGDHVFIKSKNRES